MDRNAVGAPASGPHRRSDFYRAGAGLYRSADVALIFPGQREAILRDGRLEQPSEYEEPEIITRKLIEDGRKHLVMEGPVSISCPVRIIQGMKDEAVPYEHALAFAKLIDSNDVELTLTKAGDHRLSTPDDLKRLVEILEKTLSQI